MRPLERSSISRLNSWLASPGVMSSEYSIGKRMVTSAADAGVANRLVATSPDASKAFSMFNPP